MCACVSSSWSRSALTLGVEPTALHGGVSRLHITSPPTCITLASAPAHVDSSESYAEATLIPVSETSLKILSPEITLLLPAQYSPHMGSRQAPVSP